MFPKKRKKNKRKASNLRYWLFVYFFIAARFLNVGSNIFLRILRDFGVTSSNSSVSMKSRHCSKLMIFGGVKRRASSAEEERVLVNCFLLHTFING